MTQALATTESRDVDIIAGEDLDDFVTFTVGNQLFGIPVLNVQDILTPDKIAYIPLAPAEVRGSINLRGRIVTVIDMRVRLGMGPKEVPVAETADDEDATTIKKPQMSEQQMGVTVENHNELYTLLVDGIGDVVSISNDRFDGNPNTLDPAWRDFASGVYQLEKKLMVVLDVEKVLDIHTKKPEQQKT